MNYVKENDLAHGEFTNWYQSIGLDKDFVSRSMKVAHELPNFETLRNLSNTALHLIATLPEEERTKQHETSKGELKTPDEMTVANEIPYSSTLTNLGTTALYLITTLPEEERTKMH